MAEHFERILIVRTDRLGDVVLTLPMISTLRKSFPKSYISMLLRHYTGEIVEGNPYLDKILWYDDGHAPIPFGAMAAAIRREHFDVVVVVHPTPRLAWMMFISGIPQRIGTGYRYYSFLFNHRVFEHRRDARRHELEYNLQLLGGLGCQPPAVIGIQDFGLRIPAESAVLVERRLDLLGIDDGTKIVLVHPGSGGSAREWPIEYFGDLACRLSDEPGVRIIVTGGRGEEARADAIVKATNGKAVSVVGQLGLKELAALCARASLFISNSTGPLHVAAAVGAPVIGIYPQLTPMSPMRWGPYTDRKRVYVPDKPVDCRECQNEPKLGCPCMASISVDEVLKGAHELLESGGS